MTKVKVVSGFVSLPDNPRAAEYAAMGAELFGQLVVPSQVFQNTLEDCWLYRDCLHRQGLTFSVGDFPAKNTFAYHCVQHQKTTWVYNESLLDDESEVFVWIDYGVLGQPGVTVEIVNEFLERLTQDPDPEAIVIPGAWHPSWPIWERSGGIQDAFPCWRFCGSVFVCPRSLVKPFNTAVIADAREHLNKTLNVNWEVNTWARVEEAGTVPIQWYHSDHNQSLFTSYPHV